MIMVTDINWIVEEEEIENLNLPTSLNIKEEDIISDFKLDTNNLNVEDYVIEYLSEKYGFLIQSLACQSVKSSMRIGREEFCSAIRAIENYYTTLTEMDEAMGQNSENFRANGPFMEIIDSYIDTLMELTSDRVNTNKTPFICEYCWYRNFGNDCEGSIVEVPIIYNGEEEIQTFYLTDENDLYDVLLGWNGYLKSLEESA